MSELEALCRTIEALAAELRTLTARLGAESKRLSGAARRSSLTAATNPVARRAAQEFSAAARACGRAADSTRAAEGSARAFVKANVGSNGPVAGGTTFAAGPDSGSGPFEGSGESLSPEEVALIHDYTAPGDDGGYRIANGTLREGSLLDIEEHADYIAGLNRALDKLATSPGVVYRGVVLSDDQIAGYEPGTTVVESSFWSSSRSESQAFVGTLFIVESTTGRDVAGVAARPGEQETLFRFPFRFRVESSQYDNSRRRWVIRGTET